MDEQELVESESNATEAVSEIQNPENYVLISNEKDSPISALNEEIPIEPFKNENNRSIYDVVIIGGGLSGLYSAYYLTQKCKDLKLLVIEGKDRLGGLLKLELIKFKKA